MPTGYVKKLARKHHLSTKAAEGKWKKAKAQAAKQGHSEEYDYVTSIFKKMMHESNSNNGVTLSELLEGMTLKQFLIAEAVMNKNALDTPAMAYVTSLIYDLDIPFELTKDLRRRIASEYGDSPLTSADEKYIYDLADDAARVVFNREYAGREADRRREEELAAQQAISDKFADVADQWEKATGMNAETGEDISPQKLTRGQRSGAARRNVARGQTARTIAKAQQEMQPMSEVPPEEKAERLAVAQQKVVQDKAKARKAGSGAYERKVSSNGTVYYVKKRTAMTDEDRAKERARNAAWRTKRRGVEQEEVDDVEWAMQNDDDYYDRKGNYNPRGAFDAGGHYHADRDEQPDPDYEQEEDYGDEEGTGILAKLYRMSSGDDGEDLGDEDLGDEDLGDEDLGDEDLGDEDLGDEDLGDEDLGDEDLGDEDLGDEENQETPPPPVKRDRWYLAFNRAMEKRGVSYRWNPRTPAPAKGETHRAELDDGRVVMIYRNPKGKYQWAVTKGSREEDCEYTP